MAGLFLLPLAFLPAERGLVAARLYPPRRPVERSGLEPRFDLSADLLGGRQKVGRRGPARLGQEVVEVEGIVPVLLRALDVDEDGVRREPPPFQKPQRLPEAGARHGQDAVLAG